MARTKQAAVSGTKQARALIDLPALNAKAGELIEADAEVIDALAAAGEADPHPDAVAYAKG